MDFPKDILFEIWLVSQIREKRNLALTCKTLVNHETIKKLNSYIKEHVKTICLEKFACGYSWYYSHDLHYKETNHKIQFFNQNIASATICNKFCSSTIAFEDNQISAVINWLNQRSIKFSSSGIFASYKYVQVYFKFIDEFEAFSMIKWIYVYGLLHC